MRQEKIKALMVKLLTFQRHALETGGDPLIPQAYIAEPGGTLNVVALDLALMAPAVKTRTMARLVRSMYELHAEAMAFCSDSWRGQLPKGVSRESMPADLSDWPKQYVVEELTCAGNAPGEQGVICAQTYRREKGHIIWEPVYWYEEKGVTLVPRRMVYDFRGITDVEGALRLVHALPRVCAPGSPVM